MGGIGGKASYKGITFVSGAVRVSADGGVRRLPKLHRAVQSKLMCLPLLRGLTLFLQPGMWAVLAALIVNDALTLAGADWGGGLTDAVLTAALAAALVVAWIVRRARGHRISAVRRYHAAEHMAINVYEAGLPLTAQNVAAAKRTHPRCGTSLAVIALPLGVPAVILCPYALCLVPVMCAAYEIFLALPKKRWLRPLHQAGLWVQQHVTTAAPGEKEIEAAVRGMKRLLEGERE